MADRFPVHPHVQSLLAGATELGPLTHGDSLSGASFTRVRIDGEPFVVKHLSRASDWVMRATGDELFRPLLMWRSGLFAALPDGIDPLVTGVAYDESTATASVLMRDITPWLVPEDSTFTAEAHAQFIEHMAQLHASFWGWTDDVGLCPPALRWTFLTPRVAAQEIDGSDPVPKAIPGGWAALREAQPAAWEVALSLAVDPGPLVAALSSLPQTLVHGDWKGGNLGLLPGRRTALIDWAFPSQDNALADLAWYLAVNCDRLPESKEDSVRRYREALSSAGVDTDGWWEDALALALLGGFVQMGWSKNGDELAWWAEHALAGAVLL